MLQGVLRFGRDESFEKDKQALIDMTLKNAHHGERALAETKVAYAGKS